MRLWTFNYWMVLIFSNVAWCKCCLQQGYQPPKDESWCWCLPWWQWQALHLAQRQSCREEDHWGQRWSRVPPHWWIGSIQQSRHYPCPRRGPPILKGEEGMHISCHFYGLTCFWLFVFQTTTIQTLSGTGALRVGASFLGRYISRSFLVLLLY